VAKPAQYMSRMPAYRKTQKTRNTKIWKH